MHPTILRAPASAPRLRLARAAALTGSLLAGLAHAAPAAVDNPYGLQALWTQSDAVAKAVLLILLVMSMGSWYVIIT
ncbi:MotA/TolQ/ExbB proton channel family protein, partial [Ideonella sp. BYS139W]